MVFLNWESLQLKESLNWDRDKVFQLRDKVSPLRETPIKRVSPLKESPWSILRETSWNLPMERDSNWKRLSIERASLSIERQSLSIERNSNWKNLSLERVSQWRERLQLKDSINWKGLSIETDSMVYVERDSKISLNWERQTPESLYWERQTLSIKRESNWKSFSTARDRLLSVSIERENLLIFFCLPIDGNSNQKGLSIQRLSMVHLNS